jgi:hypothetical protein
MRAFSGYLASNQLLALWDRILAYDSLEILSGIYINFLFLIFVLILVLAVGIFLLRKGNVITVTSEAAIEVIESFSEESVSILFFH